MLELDIDYPWRGFWSDDRFEKTVIADLESKGTSYELVSNVKFSDVKFSDLADFEDEEFRYYASYEPPVDFEKEDCTALSYPDGSFDAVTSSFGVRNFQELDKALGEMFRVLSNGGHLVILELSSPKSFPMKQLFHIYAKYMMPLLGRMFSKDAKAYKYLPESIAAFPQGEVMKGVLEKIGFSKVEFRRFTGGICTFYIATK
jgi:ubiquinone/menaquinone biosynthesis methyltransferase